jgi:hypothetical protein
MDKLDAKSIGGLDIEQLLIELNVLPLNDYRAELKNGDCRADSYAPRATAWLNGPVSSSCDIVAGR